MDIETLESRARNIITWKEYTPRMNVRNLSCFLASAMPEIEKEALTRAYHAGYLSNSQQGNFSFVIPIAPNFSFILDGKKLYFTLEEDCRYVALYPQILKHGEYIIPKEINQHDWAVIRIKHLFSEEQIVPQLTKRNIINSNSEGNFSIVYKSRKHREICVNLRDNKYGFKYHFTCKEDAITFSNIFPRRLGTPKIIKYD
jgi:hypothetical protein